MSKTFRVLIMGLPGAGKTHLANKLVQFFNRNKRDSEIGVQHFNADEIRKAYDDWDFSPEGRLRQATRMKELAAQFEDIVICDFVCPTPETFAAFDPHFVIWMDTLNESRFPDTNKVFQPPERVDMHIGDFEYSVTDIAKRIIESRPCGLMIGRFQPWHDGHQALFDRIMEKHGSVLVAVRTLNRSEKNPFSANRVSNDIYDKLLTKYSSHKFRVITVPNIAGVYYGRDVGYAVEKIELPEVAHVSATQIRNQMRARGEL